MLLEVSHSRLHSANQMNAISKHKCHKTSVSEQSLVPGKCIYNQQPHTVCTLRYVSKVILEKC